MSARASRACDGCRVRKVRCNATQPCSQCSHLDLECVYSPPPAKRKPGVRNRLVAQLRDKSANTPSQTAALPALGSITNGNGGVGGGGTRDNNNGITTSAPPSSSIHGGPVSASAAPAVTSIAGIVNSEPGNSPTGLSEISCSPLYSVDFFLSLLPKYEQQVYPVSPIIAPKEVFQAIENMHADLDDAALVYAFAAVTINLTTPTSWTLHGETGAQMTELMQQSLRAYRRAESTTDVDRGKFNELPINFKRIMTCVFLEISMMAFKRFDRSFAILREAMAMIQMLNVHQYSPNVATLDPSDLPRLQRLYWEVYIHERFLTTLSGYPCIMTPLASGLPFWDSTIPAHVDVGFNRLIRLFQIMDGPFLTYWSAQQNPTQQVPDMTAQWIESKHTQLDHDEASASEAEKALRTSGRGSFTELQHADLFVTRLWMRTLLWQFALSHGLLSSTPRQDAHEGLSLHFPAHRLSAQLRSLVGRLESVSSIVTHGSGILQKLFEITSTVADVLALPLSHGQTQEDVKTRMEDFIFLVRFMFSFERAEKEQRDYLREKLEVLQQQYTIVDFAELAGPSPNT